MRIAARLALQPTSSSFQRRGEDRIALRSPATMRALGYHGIDVVVRDISGSGFCADADGDFAPGSYVRLRLPGVGALHARIVWADRGQVGGNFVHPIEMGRLGRIVGIGTI